jgi:hypothetical protein
MVDEFAYVLIGALLFIVFAYFLLDTKPAIEDFKSLSIPIFIIGSLSLYIAIGSKK